MTLDLPPAVNPAALPNATTPETPVVVSSPEAPQPETTQAETTQADAATATQADTVEVSAEIELIETLWGAYRAQLDASLEQQSAAIALENAKLAYEAATEKTEVRRQEVKSILDSFCERLAEIRDPASAAIIAQVKQSTEETAVDPASDGSPTAMMHYEEWKKLSTQLIVDAKIPGLGEKKAEKLVEDFPTLGDLENARTEASQAHKHFCKSLFRGIGEKTADAIESAMSDILMHGLPNSSQVKEPAAAPAFEPEPQPAPETQPATETVSDEVIDPGYDDVIDGPKIEDPDASDDEDEGYNFDDGEIYEDVSDEDADEDETAELDSDEDDSGEETWAEAFHRMLLDDPDETAKGWGDSDLNQSDAWKAGNKAQRDWPVDACPYDESDNLELAKDWVRGWTASEMLSLDI